MQKTWPLIIEWRHKKWLHFAWRHYIIKLIRLINYKIIFPSWVKISIFYVETCLRYLTICITYWLTLVTSILYVKLSLNCISSAVIITKNCMKIITLTYALHFPVCLQAMLPSSGTMWQLTRREASTSSISFVFCRKPCVRLKIPNPKSYPSVENCHLQ